MSAAAVLAIVVAVGEAQSPLTAGLLATATESLGPATSIRLLEVKNPADADVLRLEQDLGAGAVVTLLWKEPAHLHASIRVHVASTNRWTIRAIAFLPEDSLTERGRTLGLAVGSMWPEAVTLARTATAAREPPAAKSLPSTGAPAQPPRPTARDSQPATRPANTPAPEPARPSAPEPARPAAPEPSQPSGAVPDAPTSPASTAAAGPSPRHHREIGIAAVGALGIGGPARGLGAGADGVLFVSENLSLRLGVSLRGGPLPELPGTDLVGSIAAGLEWWPILPSAMRSWGLGIRSDALALGHQVRSTGSDGQTETQSRLLPGADLSAQMTFRLGSRLDLLVGLGIEVALGNTDIRKGPARVTVATIPPFRAVGQAGFRVGF